MTDTAYALLLGLLILAVMAVVTVRRDRQRARAVAALADAFAEHRIARHDLPLYAMAQGGWTPEHVRDFLAEFDARTGLGTAALRGLYRGLQSREGGAGSRLTPIAAVVWTRRAQYAARTGPQAQDLTPDRAAAYLNDRVRALGHDALLHETAWADAAGMSRTEIRARRRAPGSAEAAARALARARGVDLDQPVTTG